MYFRRKENMKNLTASSNALLNIVFLLLLYQFRILRKVLKACKNMQKEKTENMYYLGFCRKKNSCRFCNWMRN